MSTTTAPRSLAEATAAAEAFRELFVGEYAVWEFAGSLRRRAAHVGDAEHVVIPRVEQRPAPGLFGEPIAVNLLWERADELVADGTLRKHIYGITGFRWGPKFRGMEHGGDGADGGITHEIYTADADSWGPQFTIRTGPWQYSRSLVTGLLRQGRRNIDAYVWKCRRCPVRYENEGRCCEACVHCQGTGLEPVERLSVPTEREYFLLCGMQWVEPEDRR